MANFYDLLDGNGHLLGRHLHGWTEMTVTDVIFDEDACEYGLRFAETKRILWIDDWDLPFVRYAGKLLQLQPQGERIWIA